MKITHGGDNIDGATKEPAPDGIGAGGTSSASITNIILHGVSYTVPAGRGSAASGGRDGYLTGSGGGWGRGVTDPE